jgi:hypothetical protein
MPKTFITQLLGLGAAVVTPNFGGNMTVCISAGLGDVAIFGFFFKPTLGRSFMASVTMPKEPLE